MIDLSLVSIETLIEEITSRTKNLVIGYTQVVDPGKPSISIKSHGDSYLEALGLCRELEENIIYKTRNKNYE